jgi:hypothetical protein
VIEVPVFRFSDVNTFTVTTRVFGTRAFPSALYSVSVRNFDLAFGSLSTYRHIGIVKGLLLTAVLGVVVQPKRSGGNRPLALRSFKTEVQNIVYTRRKTVTPSFRKIKTAAGKSSLKLASFSGKQNITVVVGNRFKTNRFNVGFVVKILLING